MNKSASIRGIRPIRLALAAALLCFSGCEIGLYIEEGNDGAEGEAETGGPAQPDACFIVFDACMDQADGDPEIIAICNQALLACIDPNQLPDEAGSDWGGESEGGDPDWGGESGTTGCEDAGPGACDEQLEQCLGDNPEDPEQCFMQFDECLGGNDSGSSSGSSEEGGDPPSPCEDELQQCLENNPEAPDLCFMQFDACVGNGEGGSSEDGGEPPPPDCLPAFDECLMFAESEMDIQACEDALFLCEAGL
jgi:hypothetical protein